MGAAIRGFKKAMGEEDNRQEPLQKDTALPGQSHTEALSPAGQDAKKRDTIES